jgi:hypothetical protein
MTKLRLSSWLLPAAALSLAACSGSAAATSAQSPVTSTSPVVRTQTSITPGTQPASGTSATADPQLTVSAVSCGGIKGELVSTARQLKDALKKAAPGSKIVLAPGTYDGHFTGSKSGTKAKPVVLCGPRSAVINGGSLKSGYTFHLDHASYWKVEGFTVEGGQKGVVTDNSSYDLISGLYVHSTGDEGIHLRAFSSHDTVSHNVVSHTGLYTSFYGEGIYIGSAHSNWCRYSNCKVDQSNDDIISDNSVSYTTAENIDIKEGTTAGIVEGNHFNGTGMDPSSATSWVNVKGNKWKILKNTGVHSVGDGLSNHEVYKGWGLNNYFAGNKLTVDGPGYGFDISGKRLHANVSCNNKVIGAARGFSTEPCTSG